LFVEGGGFLRHAFDFVGEAEGEHVAGFGGVDVWLLEESIVGFPDVISVGGIELFLDGGEKGFDEVVHGLVDAVGGGAGEEGA